MKVNQFENLNVEIIRFDLYYNVIGPPNSFKIFYNILKIFRVPYCRTCPT